MKNKLSLFVLMLVLSSFSESDLKRDTNKYPEPEGIDNLLFYVQRTINSNTIVYTLNQDVNGKINEQEPISAFWVKFAQGGKKEQLTYVQKKYAYGLRSKLLDKDKGVFMVEFVSYDKKQLYLIKSSHDNRYHVYSFVKNRLSIIRSIFVQIEGGSFWLPNVKYVELTAIDPNNSSVLTEMIKP